MTSKIRTLVYAALIASILLLAACAPSSTPTREANAILTEAAATVAVQLTLDAASRPTGTATNTPAPTDTPAPTNTQGAAPTAPVVATNTVAATPPPVQNTQDDAASFVSDVTIPDGTVIAPGATFEKTWRIKNTGKTTWTKAYSLIYIQGERMNAPDTISLPKDVPSGESVDITVKLTAPTKDGAYQTFFRLRNDKGQSILLDGSGDPWVKISVGQPQAATNTPGSGVTETPTVTPTPTVTATTSS